MAYELHGRRYEEVGTVVMKAQRAEVITVNIVVDTMNDAAIEISHLAKQNDRVTVISVPPDYVGGLIERLQTAKKILSGGA